MPISLRLCCKSPAAVPGPSPISPPATLLSNGFYADPLRTYSAEGFRRRAGCLIARRDEEGAYTLLLVSSSARRDGWIMPAGGLDPPEMAGLSDGAEDGAALQDVYRAAALRECWEEAGVRAAAADGSGSHTLTGLALGSHSRHVSIVSPPREGLVPGQSWARGDPPPPHPSCARWFLVFQPAAYLAAPDFPEGASRRRQWLSPAAAARLLGTYRDTAAAFMTATLSLAAAAGLALDATAAAAVAALRARIAEDEPLSVGGIEYTQHFSTAPLTGSDAVLGGVSEADAQALRGLAEACLAALVHMATDGAATDAFEGAPAVEAAPAAGAVPPQ